MVIREKGIIKSVPQHQDWVFIPNALPPCIRYDKTLIGALSDADRLLGELSGTGRLLPNPRLMELLTASHRRGN